MGLCAAGAYIHFLSPFCSLLWAVPTMVVTARWGILMGLVNVAVSWVMLSVLMGPWLSFFPVLQFGSLGLISGLLLNKGKSSGRIIAAGMIVSMLVVGSILYFPILMGIFQEEGMGAIYGKANAFLEAWEEAGLLEQFEKQGISRDELERSLRAAVVWTVSLLPSIIATYSAASSFCNFLGARAVLLRKGFEVPKFPPFREWRVPWYSSWVVISGLGLALLGDFIKVRSLFVMGLNLIILYMPLAFIIGLSVGVNFYGRIKSHFVKLIILFTAIIYLPFTLILLLLLGVFDPLLNFRKLQSKNDQGSEDL
ncbi:MAG: DUF2232 domain-containing protein [Clostridia bacterium]|nr:DUF2232 domain-containing protein [Clostridia bacterium]